MVTKWLFQRSAQWVVSGKEGMVPWIMIAFKFKILAKWLQPNLLSKRHYCKPLVCTGETSTIRKPASQLQKAGHVAEQCMFIA